MHVLDVLWSHKHFKENLNKFFTIWGPCNCNLGILAIKKLEGKAFPRTDYSSNPYTTLQQGFVVYPALVSL